MPGWFSTSMIKTSIVFILLILPCIPAGAGHGMIPLRFPPVRNSNQLDPSLDNDPNNTPIVSIQAQLLLDKASFSNNQSTACERDLQILILAASQRELWALKVFDAWGKPLPAGILKGNIFWLGNYDECVDELYQENNRSFVQQPIDTQFCRSMVFDSFFGGMKFAFSRCSPIRS